MKKAHASMSMKKYRNIIGISKQYSSIVSYKIHTSEKNGVFFLYFKLPLSALSVCFYNELFSLLRGSVDFLLREGKKRSCSIQDDEVNFIKF